MLTSVAYAPPTPSPGATTPAATPSTTTVTTSVPMTQLPTTGPSDPATAALWFGLAALIVGVLLVALVLRQRRYRTG